MSSARIEIGVMRRIFDMSKNDTDFLAQANDAIADSCQRRILRMALCMGLFSLGSFGNVRALVQLWRCRVAGTDRQTYVQGSKKLTLKMSLLIADCFVIFVFLPIKMSQIYFDYWVGGDLTCRLLTFLCPIGFFAMSFTVLAIAYDRMLYARSATQHYSWQKKITTVTCGIWGLACIVSFPRMVINSYSENQRSCNANLMLGEPSSRLHQAVVTTYTGITIGFIFFFPLIGIVIMYTVICQLVARSQRPVTGRPACHVDVNEPVNQRWPRAHMLYQHDDQHNQRPLGRRTYKVSTKARRLTALVIAPYVLSWSPYQMTSIWALVTGNAPASVWMEITLVLAVSNAVINPFLYAKADG